MLPISNNTRASKDHSDNMSHKSQQFLTLSTNSNYIQHAFNDSATEQFSGSRNSSVSINYPELKESGNELLLPSHLLPPETHVRLDCQHHLLGIVFVFRLSHYLEVSYRYSPLAYSFFGWYATKKNGNNVKLCLLWLFLIVNHVALTVFRYLIQFFLCAQNRVVGCHIDIDRTIFFLKPCSKHKCCLGCISLRDAIPLICTVEMFSLVFCSTIAIDFWINNGKTFYTINFEGYGTEIAFGYFAFVILSVCVILFTLMVWKRRQRNWYIVHIIWQWTIVELFGFFIYIVVNWSRCTEDHSILLPSALVLIGVTSFGALVEIWWLIIFVDAMLFEKTSDSYGSRRTSNENREDLESECSNSPTMTRPDIMITDNCEIVI